MSVITIQKSFEEVLASVSATDPASVWVLGCDKCGKVSKTGGTEQVVEMRVRLRSVGLMAVEPEGVPAACEDGLCDPKAVAAIAQSYAAEDVDAVLVMACGAGLKCVADNYPGRTIVPALNTLGPGVKDRLSCLSCGDCRFQDGECKMVNVVAQVHCMFAKREDP